MQALWVLQLAVYDHGRSCLHNAVNLVGMSCFVIVTALDVG
jgi:hypothetical protein